MSDRSVDEAGWSPDPSHDIPLCHVLGHIEAESGDDLAVAEAFCEPTGPIPESLETGDWMEFVDAVHTTLEASIDTATEQQEASAMSDELELVSQNRGFKTVMKLKRRLARWNNE